MRIVLQLAVFVFTLMVADAVADNDIDSSRDILVTFDNTNASTGSGGAGAPYRNRKRYAIARSALRDAAAIADEHKLIKVDGWPIRSLSIYCFVFRIPVDQDRERVIERLNADERVESAQTLQVFKTNSNTGVEYDDTYAQLQYGLDVLDITAAHRLSLGAGVRIAIVDSNADIDHEDLRGRINRHEVFVRDKTAQQSAHGTAIAGIIGARSNNALGIVGIAPEAELEVFASCWSEDHTRSAICDSFTLLKALDAMLEDPPQILNLSLAGPQDALIRRVLLKAIDAGVIVVAANPLADQRHSAFPASMEQVIGVRQSYRPELKEGTEPLQTASRALYAPGDRILVAAPEDSYDFKSGSSLSAAHVSGVIALLIAAEPQLSSSAAQHALFESQHSDTTVPISVNACRALTQVNSDLQC